MFKRITPQTIADWGERIYIRFLELTKRFTSTQIMALLAIIVGVLAGLGTCLFELLLYGIKAGLTHWFPVEQSHFLFLFYPVIGIILASLFVKYVVKDNISEGVTRVLYAMSRKNSYIASHNCWTSVVGGATTIGFGGSVGPEAPIVLTGAAIGSNISRLAHLNYKNTTLLLCCGAGAALAAIFKAPITGVVFVLEILMLDLTSRTVVPLLISSITAAAVALTIRGFDPIIAISLTPDDAFRLNQIPLFVLLGIFCGLMSYYFTTVNARVGTFFKKIDSPYKKWLIGGAVLGILIYIFPPLYGEGYEGFMSLMHGNTTELFNNSLFYRFSQIDWVVILFIVGTMFFKVIAMASTNAAGGVGGTFAPSLFVGAFMGAITALVCNTLFGWEPVAGFFHPGRYVGRNVGRDEGPPDLDLPDRRTLERLRTVHPADDHRLHLVRRGLLPRPRLDLHQAVAPEGRTADPRQGPVGVRLPETRRADGNRFPAHVH